jgi:hypothetical protein
MHRKLWTLVTLLSLLLCAATLALWARSYWVYDSIEWTSHYRTRFIACDSGRVLVQVNHGPSGMHEFEAIDFVAYVKKANEGDGMGRPWRFGGFWVQNLAFAPSGLALPGFPTPTSSCLFTRSPS